MQDIDAPAAGAPEGPAPDDEWLTTAEVAALLKVSRRAVQRWVQTDPTVEVLRLGPGGRTLRVHRSSLRRRGAASTP